MLLSLTFYMQDLRQCKVMD